MPCCPWVESSTCQRLLKVTWPEEELPKPPIARCPRTGSRLLMLHDAQDGCIPDMNSASVRRIALMSVPFLARAQLFSVVSNQLFCLPTVFRYFEHSLMKDTDAPFLGPYSALRRATHPTERDVPHVWYCLCVRACVSACVKACE